MDVIAPFDAHGTWPGSVAQPLYEKQLGDGWTLALRLGRANGQLVVTELRIYPTDDNPTAGEWNHSRTAEVVCPDAGLTARRLREINLGHWTEQALRVTRDINEIMEDHDRERALAQEIRKLKDRESRRHPDEFYGRLLDRYATHVSAGGSRPMQELATALDMKPNTLARLIKRARALAREGRLQVNEDTRRLVLDAKEHSNA